MFWVSLCSGITCAYCCSLQFAENAGAWLKMTLFALHRPRVLRDAASRCILRHVWAPVDIPTDLPRRDDLSPAIGRLSPTADWRRLLHAMMPILAECDPFTSFPRHNPTFWHLGGWFQDLIGTIWFQWFQQPPFPPPSPLPFLSLQYEWEREEGEV